MKLNTNTALTLMLGASIGITASTFVHQPVVAADDTRQQRMDESKWTTGDYARDALDHLKKAEQEMHRVAESENSKVAKDATQLCVDARGKVDQFIAELDARDKKKQK